MEASSADEALPARLQSRRKGVGRQAQSKNVVVSRIALVMPEIWSPVMYRCWLVTRHGKRLAYMVGEAIDRAEALKFAPFHWPKAEVEPNELSRVE